MLPIALLIVMLAALCWVHRNDVARFEAFAAIEDSRKRRLIFLRWAAQSCALYLGVPLAGLALLGRLDAILHLPPEFDAAAAPLPSIDTEVIGPFLGGAGIGLVIVAIGFLVRSRVWRRSKSAKPGKEPKFAAMLPRNRAEALHLLPLILNAGVSEEVCFRLYVPLLMVLSGVGAVAAFVAASLIFGLLHRYQGWVGVVATGVVGSVLALAYLACGGLWLPILLHLFINSNGLLLRPAIKHFTAARSN
jgi:membrane protease YdiL (CAAX protease family)